jgi:hypothetical protein
VQVVRAHLKHCCAMTRYSVAVFVEMRPLELSELLLLALILPIDSADDPEGLAPKQTIVRISEYARENGPDALTSRPSCERALGH